MDVVITYDLSNNKQSEVKAEMIRMGYYDGWNIGIVKYTLPSTTLWKKNITLPQALVDMNRAILNVNKIGRAHV